MSMQVYVRRDVFYITDMKWLERFIRLFACPNCPLLLGERGSLITVLLLKYPMEEGIDYNIVRGALNSKGDTSRRRGNSQRPICDSGRFSSYCAVPRPILFTTPS